MVLRYVAAAAANAASAVSRLTSEASVRVTSAFNNTLANMDTAWHGHYSYSLLDNENTEPRANGRRSSESMVEAVRARFNLANYSSTESEQEAMGASSAFAFVADRFPLTGHAQGAIVSDLAETQAEQAPPDVPLRQESNQGLALDLVKTIQKAAIDGVQHGPNQQEMQQLENAIRSAVKAFPPTKEYSAFLTELAQSLEAPPPQPQMDSKYEKAVAENADYNYEDDACSIASQPESLYEKPEPIYQNTGRLADDLYVEPTSEPIYEKILLPSPEDLPDFANSMRILFGMEELVDSAPILSSDEGIYQDMRPVEPENIYDMILPAFVETTPEPIYEDMQVMRRQVTENAQADVAGLFETSTESNSQQMLSELETESLTFVAGQSTEHEETPSKTKVVFPEKASNGDSEA